MLLAFSITPIGTGSTSVSAEVAGAVLVVRDSGLPNRTDAMFTTIEGDWDQVFAVLKAATMAVAAHSERVSVVVKADYRPGVQGALDSKVRSVEEKLGPAEG